MRHGDLLGRPAHHAAHARLREPHPLLLLLLLLLHLGRVHAHGRPDLLLPHHGSAGRDLLETLRPHAHPVSGGHVAGVADVLTHVHAHLTHHVVRHILVRLKRRNETDRVKGRIAVFAKATLNIKSAA
jgi:hypothetical protein